MKYIKLSLLVIFCIAVGFFIGDFVQWTKHTPVITPERKVVVKNTKTGGKSVNMIDKMLVVGDTIETRRGINTYVIVKSE